jgi:hypothetical protein
MTSHRFSQHTAQAYRKKKGTTGKKIAQNEQ